MRLILHLNLACISFMLPVPKGKHHPYCLRQETRNRESKEDNIVPDGHESLRRTATKEYRSSTPKAPDIEVTPTLPRWEVLRAGPSPIWVLASGPDTTHRLTELSVGDKAVEPVLQASSPEITISRASVPPVREFIVPLASDFGVLQPIYGRAHLLVILPCRPAICLPRICLHTLLHDLKTHPTTIDFLHPSHSSHSLPKDAAAKSFQARPIRAARNLHSLDRSRDLRLEFRTYPR